MVGHRTFRAMAVAAVALVLSGCSVLKVAYNAAPEAAYYWLHDFVDFTDAQAARVREDLARMAQWHRGEELPRYVALLQRMEKMTGTDIGTAQACEVSDAVRERITAMTDHIQPTLADLARQLSPAQLTTLRKRFERDDAKWRKEWLEATPAERQQRRYKLWLERLESVYGTLEDSQRVVLRQQVNTSLWDPAQSYAERQRRQRDWIDTLTQLQSAKPSDVQARAAVNGLLARTANSPDARWRLQRDIVLQEGCRVFAMVHASTTAAQREAAARRLRAYARDLQELAAQR